MTVINNGTSEYGFPFKNEFYKNFPLDYIYNSIDDKNPIGRNEFYPDKIKNSPSKELWEQFREYAKANRIDSSMPNKGELLRDFYGEPDVATMYKKYHSVSPSYSLLPEYTNNNLYANLRSAWNKGLMPHLKDVSIFSKIMPAVGNASMIMDAYDQAEDFTNKERMKFYE